MELCIAVDRMAFNDRCGCGAKSEIFGQGINSRSQRLKPTIPDLDCSYMRRRAASLRSEHVAKAEEFQLWLRERRQFIMRTQSAFGIKKSVGVETRNSETLQNCKLRFVSAAAAAGLSWTLCSSAVASPITTDGPVQMPATPVSENLRTHVETQLRRELQAQIKVQKDWLDEIGQPLNEWTIDDQVRQNLEARSRSRLDESGKPMTKLEILESEVVPIFKPSVVASKKDKVANAGIAASSITQEIPQDNNAGSKSLPSLAVVAKESSAAKTTPQAVKPTLEGATELVAVAAIPLGPVVSAASRTVGSAATMAAVQASGPAAVPGLNLLTRIVTHFGGGGVAGAMGATLVYPLDTIKTRLQAQSDEEGEEAQYKGEWDCFQQLITKEGIGALYSGLVPQLIGIAPEKAMKLTVNEILMEMLECQMPGVGAWALELIAGGGGGFSQVVFTNPMEIVKVRLQTQAKDVKQKNSWDVIKELGVRGLYNGSAMTMARDIPSSAIFFAIYTLIRQVYPDQSFVAGFMAAIPATVLVTPFDVVKTKLQMERASGEEPYKNGYACFVITMQKEGVGALFKGSVARVLKTSPQFGITLMLYNLLCGGSS